MIMNTIFVLLCVLIRQVTSQTDDIFPARILAHDNTISENSDLYVTCSTFGFKKAQMVYVYLCKDGLGTSVLTQQQEKYDTVFFIPRVGLHQSGNYSCVYSKTKYSPLEVAKSGHNTIQILVIANFLPADISVAGSSTVSAGDDVEFRCTFSQTLQTLGKCQLIQSYLRKNESIVYVQAFDVTRMEATFTIKSAVMRDSGHYSCVLLPSKCIPDNDKTPNGNNTVLLEVKVSLLVRVMTFCGVLTLILLLGLCLWAFRNKQAPSVMYNLCAEGRQPSANELEEQQEQEDGVDLESQDRESLCSGEDEWDEGDKAAEDAPFYEEVYSSIDEPPAREALRSLYTEPFKHEQKRSRDFPL
ncbi:hypothetical protein Q5P01_006234 [Channa striata]|uniref:Ig-like domain-containing protein n=1 Tax=Channa striata TaxID=64152 RepID=A0AA88NCL0_CHASR|nr:hypothetical protein Q5P01_006234 [Channa striata]